MPIRGYFLFIGPALLAFLWFIGWYMEPPRPAQPAVAAQSAAQTAAQGAAQSTIAKVSGPKAQTVGAAPSPATTTELPVAATTAAVTIPAPAAQPLPDISASNETKPADDAKPVKTATRPKKRKHLAHRPPAPGRDGYAASGYASPYGTQYRYPQQTYASPPFFRW